MSKPTIPELDPERWPTHPAWTRQAYGALVSFHDRYRRDTSRLVAAAHDRAISLEVLREACAELRENLHNHEAVEEEGLYPWIEENYEVDLDHLRREHQGLNRALDRAIERVAAAGSTRAVVRASLAHLDQTLRDHLATEEAICVPVLLEMTPDAFEALTGDPPPPRV